MLTWCTFSDYHRQDFDRPSSGFIFIYGGSSPLWDTVQVSSTCGIFESVSNACIWGTNSYVEYVPYVGSRLTNN